MHTTIIGDYKAKIKHLSGSPTGGWRTVEATPNQSTWPKSVLATEAPCTRAGKETRPVMGHHPRTPRRDARVPGSIFLIRVAPSKLAKLVPFIAGANSRSSGQHGGETQDASVKLPGNGTP